MTSAPKNSPSPQDADAVTARIDGQDITVADPIREYLVAHGCEIVVPGGDRDDITYWVIVGGLDFVKEILARTWVSSTKTLVLLWDGGPVDTHSLILPPNTKVAYVDPILMSQTEVHTLFSFFFAESVTEKNFRKNVDVPATPPAIAPSIDMGGDDRARIAKTIADVFAVKPHRPTPVKKARTMNRQLPGWVKVMGIAIFLVCLPLGWYLTTLTVAVGGLAVSAQLLLQGNQRPAHVALGVTQSALSQSRTIYPVVTWPLAIVGANGQIQQGERIGVLLSQSAQALVGAERLAVRGNVFVKNFLAPLDGTETPQQSPLVDVIGIRNEMSSLLTTLGLAQAELDRLLTSGAFPFAYGPLSQSGQRMLTVLSTYRRRLGDVYTMLTLYPHAGGFREKRTYLVLLQNSMELRPTGGFIGSLAVVTVAEGKIAAIDVQDVYAADGQLKGHVDPPAAVAELLGQEHWYLRDSNWDPDFGISAAQAAWFYEKETGTQVDGVVGLSLPLVADLLGVTGPIDLPDENDRITRDNFFAKSLYYTQNGFFPGSTQKKDFLGSLSRGIITKLLDGKSVAPLSLLRVVSSALERHDLLFYFSDPIVSELVTQAGWSGTVPSLDGCAGQPLCVGDFWYVAEANMGANKANYFVQRQDSHVVHIAEDGRIGEQTTLVYHNSAPASAGSGGYYKAYVQFMVPTDATITTVTLDGVPVTVRDKKVKGPVGLPYEEALGGAQNLRRTGIAMSVDPGQQRRLTIDYQRAVKLPVGQTYALVLQKQPGVAPHTLALQITYPIFWNALQKRDSGRGMTLGGKETFLAKEAALMYNTQIAHDQIVAVTFSK